MKKNSENAELDDVKESPKTKTTYEELYASFEYEKNKEDKRHNLQISKLKKTQDSRMKAISDQESEYKRKLNEMKIKYIRQKEKITKKHENEMKILLETNRVTSIAQQQEIDNDYIEAVAIELKKLMSRSKNGNQARERSDKLRAINLGVEEMIGRANGH